MFSDLPMIKLNYFDKCVSLVSIVMSEIFAPFFRFVIVINYAFTTHINIS